MKILFVVPYPQAKAASQRFRFEQYLDILLQHGVKIKVKSFISVAEWEILYSEGYALKKGLLLAKGFVKRFFSLFTIPAFDYIFIHREATPVGPPWYEWIVSKIFAKKIIYDFDDAIWLTDKTSESTFEKTVRWRSKIGHICRWSNKISAGNHYLADYARQFNKNVIINPTTIDTENLHNPLYYDKKALQKSNNLNGIVIGWTGSHSTLKYLEQLCPVLKLLEQKYPDVLFLVIADRPSTMNLKNVIFKKWSAETEVADLMLIDIGIMPLPDDEWTKGKCGFKALQYMALEIPAIVSPVGINSEIVDGAGYFCSTNTEWLSSLEKLILSSGERSKLGKCGREKVIRYYSVASNTSNFLSLLQDA